MSLAFLRNLWAVTGKVEKASNLLYKAVTFASWACGFALRSRNENYEFPAYPGLVETVEELDTKEFHDTNEYYYGDAEGYYGEGAYGADSYFLLKEKAAYDAIPISTQTPTTSSYTVYPKNFTPENKINYWSWNIEEGNNNVRWSCRMNTMVAPGAFGGVVGPAIMSENIPLYAGTYKLRITQIVEFMYNGDVGMTSQLSIQGLKDGAWERIGNYASAVDTAAASETYRKYEFTDAEITIPRGYYEAFRVYVVHGIDGTWSYQGTFTHELFYSIECTSIADALPADDTKLWNLTKKMDAYNKVNSDMNYMLVLSESVGTSGEIEQAKCLSPHLFDQASMVFFDPMSGTEMVCSSWSHGYTRGYHDTYGNYRTATLQMPNDTYYLDGMPIKRVNLNFYDDHVDLSYFVKDPSTSAIQQMIGTLYTTKSYRYIRVASNADILSDG